MTSSSDAEPRPIVVQQLRTGAWTRLGDDNVLGDLVTENLLGGLAERTRAAARAQGYAHGWSAGRREALQQEGEAARRRAAAAQQEWDERERARAAEHEAAMATLTAALAEATERVTELCAHVEQRAVSLAYELVEHVLDRELAVAPPQDVVRRAMRLLPPDGAVAVRLHPATAASEAVRELRHAEVAVREDATLAVHDVVVELADGSVIDGRLTAALHRLGEVWRG
ncbi:hypothetical protein D9V41_05160 [Aeromicrobium phragmitis]|uniref:Flagellar assembly protein FliH/Type III secretion system HrpE domain-containing protein n=1 Tax=Aeromicrobium phragmitis TaxID=2478914 RepID=A0A3L8PPV1_9ACTN|nr:FliH/SctL family protein [Aeromicrobium phragmitis]RLV56468.1 hypothetical protein D9V41_05160 [Aeromicrobium phragmitis]